MSAATATRTNRYAGTCHKCGGHVAANAGTLTKGANGWLIAHQDCGTQASAARSASRPATGWSRYSRRTRYSCPECGETERYNGRTCGCCGYDPSQY